MKHLIYIAVFLASLAAKADNGSVFECRGENKIFNTANNRKYVVTIQFLFAKDLITINGTPHTGCNKTSGLPNEVTYECLPRGSSDEEIELKLWLDESGRPRHAYLDHTQNSFHYSVPMDCQAK